MSSDQKLTRPPIEQFAEQEKLGEKSVRKIKDNPMVPLGMLGFFGAVYYGYRQFQNRDRNYNAGFYVMRYRVFAQSIAVGAIVLGVGYQSIKKNLEKDELEPTVAKGD